MQNTLFPHMFYIHSGFGIDLALKHRTSTFIALQDYLPDLQHYHHKIQFSILRFMWMLRGVRFIWTLLIFWFLIHYGLLSTTFNAYGHTFGHSAVFFSLNTLHLTFCGFHAVSAVWFMHSFLFSFLQIYMWVHSINHQHQLKSFRLMQIEGVFAFYMFKMVHNWAIYLINFQIGGWT